MSAAVISLFPVFGLIALGSVVGRMKLLSDEGWRGVEGLNYWILFPALLFQSVASAELSGNENSRLALATVVTALVLSAVLLAVRRRTRLSGPAYSSLFQTALRWNGYSRYATFFHADRRCTAGTDPEPTFRSQDPP